MTALAITKLDVLSGLDRLQVCTRYRGVEGAEFEDFPYHQSVLHHATGEYVELTGGRTTSASAAARPTCQRRRATT